MVARAANVSRSMKALIGSESEPAGRLRCTEILKDGEVCALKPTSNAAPFWPPVHWLSDVLARLPPGVCAMTGFPGHDGSPGAPKLKITLSGVAA
jgi:hypothetical protein